MSSDARYTLAAFGVVMVILIRLSGASEHPFSKIARKMQRIITIADEVIVAARRLAESWSAEGVPCEFPGC